MLPAFLSPLLPILSVLNRDGAETRCVGGCVRDYLLGIPSADIDMATSLPPDQVMRLLQQAGIRTVPTGLAHGTITALLNRQPIQITTLRRDVATDGRRAVIAYTSDWAVDAARRDFTINALSMGMDGTIYDYSDGQADLAARRVRFIGDPDQRIQEDYLRILRFYRFHARFAEGEMDPAALAACRRQKAGLASLSGERIWAELQKILPHPKAKALVARMVQDGILAEALPDVQGAGLYEALQNLAQRLQVPLSPITALAALLHGDGGGGVVQRVRDRLHFSGADHRLLADLFPPVAVVLPDHLVPLLYRHGPDVVRALTLLQAAKDRWADADVAQVLAAVVSWVRPGFPLTGADILALGLPPGPAVGQVITAVETWWLAQQAKPDRAACLAKARDVLKNMAGA
jgi:poly(A) polymerase